MPVLPANASLSFGVADLGQGYSTIDDQRLASDIRGRIANHEESCRGQLLRIALAPHQDPRHLRLQVARVELRRHLRRKETWRQRVYPDSLPSRPLLRQVARKADDRGFARGVSGLGQTGCCDAQKARDV